MTTSVRVSARARGARVETNGETVELRPHEDRNFHIEEGSQTFTVTEFTAEEADQREQEALAASQPNEQPADTQDSTAEPTATETPPTGNESGATETTATTEIEEQPRRGRGRDNA